MPVSTPPFVSQLVKLCWSALPEERPPFSEIVSLFSKKLGLEEAVSLKPRRTMGFKGFSEAKSKRTLMKMDDFRDQGDYAIVSGSGLVIHQRMVQLKKELKEAEIAGDAKS